MSVLEQRECVQVSRASGQVLYRFIPKAAASSAAILNLDECLILVVWTSTAEHAMSAGLSYRRLHAGKMKITCSRESHDEDASHYPHLVAIA